MRAPRAGAGSARHASSHAVHAPRDGDGRGGRTVVGHLQVGHPPKVCVPLKQPSRLPEQISGRDEGRRDGPHGTHHAADGGVHSKQDVHTVSGVLRWYGWGCQKTQALRSLAHGQAQGAPASAWGVASSGGTSRVVTLSASDRSVTWTGAGSQPPPGAKRAQQPYHEQLPGAGQRHQAGGPHPCCGHPLSCALRPQRRLPRQQLAVHGVRVDAPVVCNAQQRLRRRGRGENTVRTALCKLSSAPHLVVRPAERHQAGGPVPHKLAQGGPRGAEDLDGPGAQAGSVPQNFAVVPHNRHGAAERGARQARGVYIDAPRQGVYLAQLVQHAAEGAPLGC